MKRSVAVVGDSSGFTGAASVTFSGLSAVPWRQGNGSVNVVVQRIPDPVAALRAADGPQPGHERVERVATPGHATYYEAPPAMRLLTARARWRAYQTIFQYERAAARPERDRRTGALRRARSSRIGRRRGLRVPHTLAWMIPLTVNLLALTLTEVSQTKGFT
jgi:hypothetical protein